MDFTLPDTADDLRREIEDRFGRDLAKPGSTESFHTDRWQTFAELGLWDPEVSDHLHRAVGYAAVSRQGLVGPVVESYLAVRSRTDREPVAALERGKIVTSVIPRADAATAVGWGAIATAVYSQADGALLTTTALPPVTTALGQPHGWLPAADDPDADLPAQLRIEAWLYGAAALSGLIDGALALTISHAKTRHQFGKPIAAFQAVQMPLAEAKVLADGARLSMLDAAQRLDDGDASADVCAAMAWLFAHRASRFVERVAHQTYGALGFSLESGLPQITGSMAWLRNSLPADATRALVMSRRPAADVTSQTLVMEGFGMP